MVKGNKLIESLNTLYDFIIFTKLLETFLLRIYKEAVSIGKSDDSKTFLDCSLQALIKNKSTSLRR